VGIVIFIFLYYSIANLAAAGYQDREHKMEISINELYAALQKAAERCFDDSLTTVDPAQATEDLGLISAGVTKCHEAQQDAYVRGIDTTSCVIDDPKLIAALRRVGQLPEEDKETS
jgi:hypothetical protein